MAAVPAVQTATEPSALAPANMNSPATDWRMATTLAPASADSGCIESSVCKFTSVAPSLDQLPAPTSSSESKTVGAAGPTTEASSIQTTEPTAAPSTGLPLAARQPAAAEQHSTSQSLGDASWVQPQAPTSQPVPSYGSHVGEQKTLNVMRDVRFSRPAATIVHLADPSGLTTTTSSTALTADGAKLTPPKLTKEIIEWLASQRLRDHELMMGVQSDVRSQRLNSMLLRQRNAARQVRLANKLNGMLAREILDDSLSGEQVETNIRRHETLNRKQRPNLWGRLNEVQQLLADQRSAVIFGDK